MHSYFIIRLQCRLPKFVQVAALTSRWCYPAAPAAVGRRRTPLHLQSVCWQSDVVCLWTISLNQKVLAERFSARAETQTDEANEGSISLKFLPVVNRSKADLCEPASSFWSLGPLLSLLAPLVQPLTDLFAANLLACYKQMEAVSPPLVPRWLLVLPRIQWQQRREVIVRRCCINLKVGIVILAVTQLCCWPWL